jgi:hypothetical protein
VDAGIFREFGVEGGGHGFSLLNRYRILPFCSEDFDAFADVLAFRGANENHFDGRCAEEAFADGAIDLASVGVAADSDVEGAQAFLIGILYFGGKEDGSGARAKSGLGANEVLQFSESLFAKQFEERAGFAARDDESVDGVELLGLFDEDNLGAKFFKTAAVGIEIALQGQNSYFHGGIDFSGWSFGGVKVPRRFVLVWLTSGWGVPKIARISGRAFL